MCKVQFFLLIEQNFVKKPCTHKKNWINCIC